MKKALLIVGGLLLILVIALVAAATFVDANQWKEPLVKKIGESINAHVEVGDIDLSVLPYLGLELTKVTLSNQKDSAFSEKKIASCESCALKIHLKSLFKRHIIATLIMKEPNLWYRTNKAGKTNIDELLSAKDEKKSDSEKSGWIEKAEFEAISIENASVNLIDQKTADQPTKISHLSLKISPLSLTDPEKPSSIEMSARLFDAQKENISIKGKLLRNKHNDSVDLNNFKMSLGGSPLNVAGQIKDLDKKAHFTISLSSPGFMVSSLYALKADLKSQIPEGTKVDGNVGLTIKINGTADAAKTKLGLDLKELAIQSTDNFKKKSGSPGQLNLSYQGPLADVMSGRLQGDISLADFSAIDVLVQNLQSKLAYHDQILNFSEMTLNLFSGTAEGKEGHIDMHGEKIKWKFDIRMKNIDVNQVLAQVAGYPDVMTGKGNLDVTMQGQGSTSADIKKALSANGSLSMQDGSFHVENLASALLGSQTINAIKGAGTGLKIAGLTSTAIAEPKFIKKNKVTQFAELATQFRLIDGKVNLPVTQIKTPHGPISIQGTSSLEGMLDMHGDFFLSKEKSDQWLGNNKIKTYLVDSNGKLIIPFKMGGSLKSPTIVPDVTYLTRKIQDGAKIEAQSKVKGHVTKTIDKVIPKTDVGTKEVKDAVKETFKGIFN